jgi:hypothetical protein
MSKINSFVLVLIVAISLASCETDKSKNLFNTWRIEDIKPSKPNPPLENYIKAQLPLMKYMQRITYNADGTTAETVGARVDKGTWDMNKTGKMLYVTNESRGTVRYILVELTKDKFTYQMLNGPDTLTFYWVPFAAKDTLNKPAMPQMQPQSHAAPADDQQQEGGNAPAQQGQGNAQAPKQPGK